MKQLKKAGHDTDTLWREIKYMILKCFCAGRPFLKHEYKCVQPRDKSKSVCYEVLGIDVMIDENFKPYLIEFNYLPSFGTDAPVDLHVKKSLIRDTLKLV